MSAKPSSEAVTRRIRWAGVAAGTGLALQLAAALHWTPATFILSAVIGVPLVLAGGVLFLSAVWRNMKDKGAV
jgi:hypothetical protein